MIDQTKKQKVLNWILNHNIFYSSDLNRWALENYCLSCADRYKRQFLVKFNDKCTIIKHGFIVSLNPEQKKKLNIRTNQGVYVLLNEYMRRGLDR